MSVQTPLTYAVSLWVLERWLSQTFGAKTVGERTTWSYKVRLANAEPPMAFVLTDLAFSRNSPMCKAAAVSGWSLHQGKLPRYA